MSLAEKGVRGKGRQPLSPPQHTVARSANSAPKRFNWARKLLEMRGERDSSYSRFAASSSRKRSNATLTASRSFASK